MIKTFRDLVVWQKAKEMVVVIYKYTGKFPEQEKFGVVQQIRRAAVSVPSNIAEGYGRRSTNDYKRFLNIAMGSLFEVQTLLEISRELSFISIKVFDDLFDRSREIERMLSALLRKLR